MERVGIFLAGVATGWAVRTTVDSSRALAVRVISSFYGVVDHVGRAVGMEREHMEDLLAEARAHYENSQAARRPRAPGDGASQNGASQNGRKPGSWSDGAPASPSAQDRAA
jgi:hypothetical protein